MVSHNVLGNILNDRWLYFMEVSTDIFIYPSVGYTLKHYFLLPRCILLKRVLEFLSRGSLCPGIRKLSLDQTSKV